MPELPEVETVRRGLEPLVGRRATALRCDFPGVLQLGEGRSPRELEGAHITGTGRRAKLLWLEFSGGLRLAVHLRMTGELTLEGAGAPRRPHTHVSLALDRGQELRFRDPRRFGRVQLLDAVQLEGLPFVRRLGPEPDELDPPTLAARLGHRSTTLKSALLDQSVVAGLGNIYVDEALHRAGLHPELWCNSLRGDEPTRLCASIHAVLGEALAAGGSSIRDYRRPDRSKGAFQRQHLVFGRGGEACHGCGEIIRRSVVAGRGTHHCPRCQPRRQRVRRRVRRPSTGRG